MAFATADDIASRLGRALGVSETAPVDLLLELATGAIAAAADRDDDWAAALSPVPTMLKAICIELVVRALANPQNLDSMQEGLGAHQYSVRFRQAGILPTEMEERIIRRTVYGTNAASTRANDLANHVGFDTWPQTWGDIYLDENIVAS